MNELTNRSIKISLRNDDNQCGQINDERTELAITEDFIDRWDFDKLDEMAAIDTIDTLSDGVEKFGFQIDTESPEYPQNGHIGSIIGKLLMWAHTYPDYVWTIG